MLVVLLRMLAHYYSCKIKMKMLRIRSSNLAVVIATIGVIKLLMAIIISILIITTSRRFHYAFATYIVLF